MPSYSLPSTSSSVLIGTRPSEVPDADGVRRRFTLSLISLAYALVESGPIGSGVLWGIGVGVASSASSWAR